MLYIRLQTYEYSSGIKIAQSSKILHKLDSETLAKEKKYTQMNLSVLIIDDDPRHSAQLIEYLKRLPYLVKTKVIHQPTESLKELIDNTYDLLFLDIEMPDLNGLELLQTFTMPPTIVVSAHPSYAIDCFDLDTVVDFIEKPVSFNRIMRALKRALTKVKVSVNNHLYLKAGRQMQHFYTDSIHYIEADGIYSKVWSKKGDFVLVNDNISEVEKKLCHTRLVRLHKSYIFNLNHITAFDSRNLWLGEKKFQVGVSYRGRLTELLELEGTIE
ncbi:LytR/AlgR family response regulator transcription factor [Runella slithyformis]|uniref:Two component transcriptional regulator, LytTR family n=1 Tax=Runella slithyformis (strain ATCC 29530 / DSM 19594 / LMG 11500 / NCIMB 11436 / LSU 4) TaxID=761193 RepID=A0A7U3ZQC9_RUNSL|nr:LytTR family DNA-binding domain-containing protein [Runella slithyformis]AEI51424.1 two component transcriptional regulator, LytTR family [Runella slithyformis DSM 19594]